MKNRIFAGLVALMLVFSTAALGETAPLSPYAELKDLYYQLLINGSDDLEEIPEGFGGVAEAIEGQGPGEAMSMVGYLEKDLNGDGINEFMVGEVPDGAFPLGNVIYALYTLKDGAPQLVFEGWYRSSYRMMDDGSFYYTGSSSAFESAFGTFILSEDGTELIWKDFYFNEADPENEEAVDFYHNTTGVWDAAASQKLQISLDDYYSIMDEIQIRTVKTQLTPFID